VSRRCFDEPLTVSILQIWSMEDRINIPQNVRVLLLEPVSDIARADDGHALMGSHASGQRSHLPQPWHGLFALRYRNISGV
jgi:hypothetical protein